ncbi:TonB-dependent receptor [Maricurvus nonylphenolicus]|uniref:TonB-dependent receptor n=1 Tax=Maricurvus nonylphenolicus TaxID=1008307 RepID=UPI0036F3FD21
MMKTRVIPLAAAIAACSTPLTYAQDSGQSIATLEEIVVTAQRREESLSEVPLSVTAADSEALAQARVENIANVSAISPSVQFNVSNNSSASANIVVRGLGTVGNSRSFEGGVGVFIDGVYRTRSGAALESFLDVDSLQILRGPQGTLFGKNTSAGAVIINSTLPSFEDVETSYNIGFGNFGSQDYKAAINIPLSDSSAVRIAALYSEDDGFYEDVNTGDDLNGKDTEAIKLQWLWQPNEELSVHLIADKLKSEGNVGYGTTDLIDSDITALTDAIQLGNGLTLPSDDLGDFESALNTKTKQTVDDEGLVLKVEYDTDAGVLTSTTAYRQYSLIQDQADGDFSGADLLILDEEFKSDFFSQEFTFAGDIESLNGDYILGLFYSKEDIEAERDLYWGSDANFYYDTVISGLISEAISNTVAIDTDAQAGLFASEIMEAEAESIAIFAHANFDLGEQWKLVAGLRYSEEKKSGSFLNDFIDTRTGVIGVTAASVPVEQAACTALGNLTHVPAGFGGPGCAGLLNPFSTLGVMPSPAYDEDHTDRAFSGTLGLQYFVNEDTMAYLTLNHGFKAGGVNIDANAAGTAANNPALVLGATPLDPTYDPETIDGVELGLKTTYWDGRARANIAAFYNEVQDLQVAQFVGLQFTILNADSAKSYGIEFENMVQLNDTFSASLDATWLPYAKYGRDDAIDESLSNQRMKWAPHVTANAALNFEQPIADNFSLTGRVQYQYRSSQYISSNTLAKDDNLGLINANLALVSEDQGWQLELWGQNLAGKDYATYAFSTPLQTGDMGAYAGAPRTYGITLRGSF